MIFSGIDAGSRTVKVLLFDPHERKILGAGIADQGIDQSRSARELFEKTLSKSELSRLAISKIVATGYGRNNVDFADTTVTEITCHAKGVRHLLPNTTTIIEIGGQDSKLIRLDPDGTVRDFAMNDRCAAGTGRFLEIVANRLEVDVSSLDTIAQRSAGPASINSMCVVFAETEIIGLLTEGVPVEDIVAGIQMSIAQRAASMAGRRIDPPVVLTGGVALLGGIARALEQSLNRSITICPNPQFTGALGAALIATTL